MNLKPILVGGALLLTSLSQAHAVVLETSNFIGAPTNFNGFEGVGTTGTLSNSGKTYTEGGISITASTGTAPIGAFPYWNGVGSYQWYGGTTTYTDIKLQSGGDFQSLQFLASSGYANPTTLAYEVLNHGAVVLTGTVANPAYCCGTSAGFAYFGFSGGGFDEVRLVDGLVTNFSLRIHPKTV